MIFTEGLKYSPQTGLIYRAKPTTEGTRSKRGPIMGKNGRGYRVIHVKRRLWRQHRLAFYFMGYDLTKNNIIDHINGNINDNRWNNLRIVDSSGNALNRLVHRKGKEPYIYKKPDSKSYFVSIHINGVYHHLRGSNLEDAIFARDCFLKENSVHRLNNIKQMGEK